MINKTLYFFQMTQFIKIENTCQQHKQMKYLSTPEPLQVTKEPNEKNILKSA